MNIIFQSQRLYFRKFTDDDIQLLFDLDSNPNVIKFLHRPALTLENVAIRLHENILPHYDIYGYGRLAVHLKSNNEFIGSCGLKYLREADEIDLGYRFNENFWGKGFGFEAAKATIDYGFTNLKVESIFARALPQNTASWKIMEKCGMQYVGDVVDDDRLTVKKYSITNDE